MEARCPVADLLNSGAYALAVGAADFAPADLSATAAVTPTTPAPAAQAPPDDGTPQIPDADSADAGQADAATPPADSSSTAAADVDQTPPDDSAAATLPTTSAGASGSTGGTGTGATTGGDGGGSASTSASATAPPVTAPPVTAPPVTLPPVTPPPTGGTPGVQFAWSSQAPAQPTLTSPGDRSSAEGDVVNLAIAGTTPAGTLTYAAVDLPTGLSIDPTSGTVSGTIADTAAEDVDGGRYATTVVATNGLGGSASASFTWTVAETDTPPVFVATLGGQSNQAGDTVSLNAAATTLDGRTIQYSAQNLPDGLGIDADTGLISGQIDPAAPGGDYAVTVTALNGWAETDESFTWTVTANPVPVVSSIADQTNSEGDTVSLAVSATVSGLTYSADGLPDGLTIDPATGVISGTLAAGSATEAGSPQVVTVVADDGLVRGTQSFDWTVNPSVALPAPGDQTNAVGDAVALSLAAAAPAGTISYSATGLPDGSSIDPTTGIVSGTLAPDAADAPADVEVTATDGDFSTTQDFTWTVIGSNAGSPSLASPGDQTGLAGSDVVVSMAADNADGGDLNYTATGLPDGLEIDPDTGDITGTIQDDAVSATPYAVTVTVDDGQGGTASTTFNWTVSDPQLALQPLATSAAQGADATLDLATFIDPDENRRDASYDASINWGDGTTSDACVVASDDTPGLYTVEADHAYAASGNFAATATVTDPTGATCSGTGFVAVSGVPMSFQNGTTEPFRAGTGETRQLGTLDDGNSLLTAGDYAVQIGWGDGSTSAGYLTGTGGVYSVNGTHAFAEAGDYAITVVVTDPQGRLAQGTATAAVGQVQAGWQSTLTATGFASASPASDALATIAWGDGTTTSGAVTDDGAGDLTVTGQHVFALDGTYAATVTLTTPTEGVRSATGTVTVAAGALVGYAAQIVGGGTGQPVAVVTSENPAETPFAATFLGGNGGAQVQSLGGGLFAVKSQSPVTPAANDSAVVDIARNGRLVESLYCADKKDGLGFPEIQDDEIGILRVLEWLKEGENLAKSGWADSSGSRITVASLDAAISNPKYSGVFASTLAFLKLYVFPPDSSKPVGPAAIGLGITQKIWDKDQGLTKNDIAIVAKILADFPDEKTPIAKTAFAKYNEIRDLIANRGRAKVWAGTAPAADAYQSVRQGSIGDCSAMAAIIGDLSVNGGLAARDKGLLPNIVLDVPTGKYLVTFYKQVGGKPVLQLPVVAVDPPTDAEYAVYGRTTDNTLWLSILEKAYVQAWPTSLLTRFNILWKYGTNSVVYQNAAGGYGQVESIERITGYEADTSRLTKLDDTRLENILNSCDKKVVLLGSKSLRQRGDWTDTTEKDNPNVPAQHSFAVVAFNTTTKFYTLRNPWNDKNIVVNGRVWGQEVKLTLDEIRHYFAVTSYQK